MELIMRCDRETFNELAYGQYRYPCVHLFKNYYLMRNNTWANMGPSLWGLVKVEDRITEKSNIKNPW